MDARHLYCQIFILNHTKALDIKDLKSELRMKLMEYGGALVARLRSLEISAEHHASIHDLFLRIRECRSFGIIAPRVVSSNLVRLWDGEQLDEATGAEPEYDCLLGALVKNPELGPQSDKFLALLLQSLSDPGPLVRVRAVRELGRILQAKDPLLRNSNFLATVQKRVDDSSPCVREAAIDFIASASAGSLSTEVFSTILNKISDPATSVRKRATKLIIDYLSDGQASAEWLPKQKPH